MIVRGIGHQQSLLPLTIMNARPRLSGHSPLRGGDASTWRSALAGTRVGQLGKVSNTKHGARVCPNACVRLRDTLRRESGTPVTPNGSAVLARFTCRSPLAP